MSTRYDQKHWILWIHNCLINSLNSQRFDFAMEWLKRTTAFIYSYINHWYTSFLLQHFWYISAPWFFNFVKCYEKLIKIDCNANVLSVEHSFHIKTNVDTFQPMDFNDVWYYANITFAFSISLFLDQNQLW